MFMESFKVKILVPFVNPKFMRHFVGRQFILEPNERKIFGVDISIENDPKVKMIIHGSWNPIANRFDDYELAKNKRVQEQENYLKELTQRKENAISFNESLEIPVMWSSEIKEVLSGLSENSWGDGQKRNSVHHIFLHEPLTVGRLKRERNSFLCSQPKIYGDWSGTLGINGLERKVTCKTCLKIANKLKKDLHGS